MSDRKIDVWFPVKWVSKASERERSFAIMSPLNKLHIWWSRKPHALSRAAVLLTLAPRNADEKALEKLLAVDKIRTIERRRKNGLNKGRVPEPYQVNPMEVVLPDGTEGREALRELFREGTGSESPLVVDPMAGGGSIPFEALRLGCRVIAGELNPVAWLVLKATLEYPVEYGGELLEKMRGFFTEVRRELTERVGRFYGDNDRAYVWIKWVECPSCGLKIPCTPNWWLLKKKDSNGRIDRERSMVIIPSYSGDEVEFDVAPFGEVEDSFDPHKGTVKSGVIRCPKCRAKFSREQVHRLFRRQFEGEPPEDRPFVRAYLAAVVGGSGRERKYRAATDRDLEFFERAREELFERWDELIAEDLIPTEEIPKYDSERVLSKGVDRFYKLFNERQLLAHAELLRVIRELSGGLDNEHLEPLTVYAMIAFDKMINYNTICSRWHYGRGVVVGIFDQHAYAWSWDHGEMNVLAEDGGWNWAAPSVLEAYEEIVKLLRGVEERPRVVIGDARELPVLLDEEPDAIVVDPPYYDNVQYAELADFFHVWLKRAFGHKKLLKKFSRDSRREFRRAFRNKLTPKENEIVANKTRQKDLESEFEKGLRDFLKACREVLPEDGRLTVMFAHKRLSAWEALVRALRDAEWEIVETWPVMSEMGWSLHQRGKRSLETTVVFACRPVKRKERGSWLQVQGEIEEAARERLRRAMKVSDSPADWLTVALGAALGPYTKYSEVRKPDGEQISAREVMDAAYDAVLNALNEVMEERFSMGGLDESGRFYALVRYLWGYPGKSQKGKWPEWKEVLTAARACRFDVPHDLVEVTDGVPKRAYVKTFEDRESTGSRTQLDALHRALREFVDEGSPSEDTLKRAEPLLKVLDEMAKEMEETGLDLPAELSEVRNLMTEIRSVTMDDFI